MALEKLSYSQISEASSTMKSCNGIMGDMLERVKFKINLINDPKVWKSKNASDLKDRLSELAEKFPKFTDALGVFTSFLDDVVAKNKEEDEKEARRQGEEIG
jgi:hypothetical protein